MENIIRPFDEGNIIVKDIINHVKKSDFYKIEGDLNDFSTSISPIISNAIFARDNNIKEVERFETLITLARVLDNENLYKAINALKYELTIKK